eukprot:168853_1
MERHGVVICPVANESTNCERSTPASFFRPETMTHSSPPQNSTDEKVPDAPTDSDTQTSSWLSWMVSSAWNIIGYEAYQGGVPYNQPPHIVSYVKRICIIGVHGWALVGGYFQEAPEVTSRKLCDSLADAVRQILRAWRVDLSKVEFTNIALHGYGQIEARAAAYTSRQLQAHREAIETSEIVLFACHSQGALVTSLVVAWLIDNDWLKPEIQSVGMLSLAGVHHGPFPDLPTEMTSSTRELFTLALPSNSLAKRAHLAMSRVLESGVRVMCAAAFMDQVVPLYSACLHCLTSPNLRRALFVDQRFSDEIFLGQICELMIELANRGITLDLAPHISPFFRASLLQSPRVHTTIHWDSGVFIAAAEWMVADPGLVHEPSRNRHGSWQWGSLFKESFSTSPLNQHFLGQYLSEFLDKAGELGLGHKIEALRRSFSEWVPASKSLSVLKIALEPVFGVPMESVSLESKL